MNTNESCYDPFAELFKREFAYPDVATKWLNRYVKFIKAIQVKRNVDQPNEKWNRHVHHIVPRIWGGLDVEQNTITLTLKEHIVAHHLLCKTLDPSMGFAMVKLMGFQNREHIDPLLTFNYVVGLRIAADANKARFLKLQKKVCNLNTGAVYDSLLEASITEYGNYWAVPTAVMNHTAAQGSFWMKVEDMEYDRRYYLDLYTKLATDRRKTQAKTTSRQVINLDTGEYYCSASQAAQAIGCNGDALTDAIRNKTTLKGYNWDYVDNINGDPRKELEKRIAFKHYNDKYSECRTYIDVVDGTKFDSLQSAAEHFGLSVVVFGRYIRAYRPLKENHYIVKQTMYDELGQETLLEMLSEWNKGSTKATSTYKKTKRVINLSTGEIFDSVNEASVKYPNDHVRHYVRARNPSPSGYYWMYVDNMIKTAEQHLAENEQHFKDVGSKKRRDLNNHSNVPVTVLNTGENYRSITDCAAALKLQHGNLVQMFKKNLYYVNGNVIVPSSMLDDIPDVDEFIDHQHELYRTAETNKSVVNLTTKQKYSSTAIAAKLCSLPYSSTSDKLRKKSAVNINGQLWIRERYIDKDTFKSLQLEFVA